MPQCPYCSADVIEKYNFCLECEKQIKCLKCGEELTAGKSICLFCGNKLNLASDFSQAVNSYSCKESYSDSESSREINIRFTDDAIKEVVPAIAHLVNPSLQPPRLPAIARKEQELVEQASDGIVLNQEAVSNQITTKSTKKENNINTQISSTEEVSKYFIEEDGFLILHHTGDLKGKTKKEQQERFLKIYGCAYSKIFNKPIPNREHFITAAQKSNLYDPNFNKYISNIIGTFFTETSSGFHPKPTLDTEVISIIEDICNPEITGFVSASKTSRKKRSSMSNSEKDKVSDWVKNNSVLDGFDIRSLEKSVDYAIFALYDLTKIMNVEQSVKPAAAYEYMEKRYKTIDVKKKTFLSVFRPDRNPELFSKNTEGEYFLKLKGEERAKEITQDFINSKTDGNAP